MQAVTSQAGDSSRADAVCPGGGLVEPNRSVTLAAWFRRCLVSDDTPEQLPTLVGCVDGIVSLDPPMIQCRGCGVVHTGQPGKLALLVLTSNIVFHVGDGRTRRLCADCRAGCTCPTCRDLHNPADHRKGVVTTPDAETEARP